MSELIILGLLSYPTSHILNTISAVTFLKDIVDNGYKLNVDNFRDFLINNQDNNPLQKFQKVPFLNIAAAISSGLTYASTKAESILALNTMDCLEKLTKEEEEYYSKKPGFISALKINRRTAIKAPAKVRMPVDPKLTLEERNAMKEEMERNYAKDGYKVDVTLYPGKEPKKENRMTDEEIDFLQDSLIEFIESDDCELTVDAKKRTRTIVPKRKR